VIVIKNGATVVIRAKNIRHAILIFDKKFGYDLQFALQNENYTMIEEGN
jgi:hypothetical protein